MHTSEDVTTFDLFRNRFGVVLAEDLCYSHQMTSQISEQVYKILSEKGVIGLPLLYDYLNDLGVRDRWNTTFRYHRASYIAKWVLPYLRGRVLDVLGGDGRIARVLREYGCDVAVTERPGIPQSYTNYEQDQVNWVDHDLLFSLEPNDTFDTVLLSTALHHEADPIALLAGSCRIARQRVVIIENCIEEGLSSNFHVLVDDFFNNCLNRTPLPCPAQHRSLDEWLNNIPKHARPVMIDRIDALPGVPLSHHLIVAHIEQPEAYRS